MDSKKRIVKELKKTYKGFSFEYDGKVLVVETKLPFRVMIEDTYGFKHCDDKTYQKIQHELRRELYKIDSTNTIVIVECGYLQYFTSNLETIHSILDHIKTFIKAKTEEYGKYIKMGRECNKELLKELGMTDAKNPPKVEKKIKRVVRPVLQYDLDGEFIKEWESAYEAAEEVSGLRGAVGNIYNACTGRYKTAYGFIWKYKV